MNITGIRAKYLELHNTLGSRKDAEDKELFDQQHAQIWANCDAELQTRKAELVAKTTLTKDEAVELKELKFQFPDPLPPFRDLAIEIENLRARVEKLENK